MIEPDEASRRVERDILGCGLDEEMIWCEKCQRQHIVLYRIEGFTEEPIVQTSCPHETLLELGGNEEG